MELNALLGIAIIIIVTGALTYLLGWSMREINKIARKKQTIREILRDRSNAKR